jgi:hypothetical protein
MDYQTYLASKKLRIMPKGFDVAQTDINPMLFDWQRAVVQWACKQGRAALFEECGLGKTIQQLEWARLVAVHTGKPSLVLTPLAVAHQTVAEAKKLNLSATYCRSQADADDSGSPVIVANYEMLAALDAGKYGGVVLDESSILKSFSGAIRNQLIETFTHTPYRLACTATPAPNDHMELGNHAEFLGLMQRVQMLAMYFKHDGGSTAEWRIKRHGEKDFWKWVTSWAVCVSKPSDLGYSDAGYDLPPLNLHEHVVPVDHSRAEEKGQLFMDGTISATALWAEKRLTVDARCQLAANLVNEHPDEFTTIWCDTNDEADALRDLLPDAVEVRGSDSVANKEKKLNAFSDQQVKQIITKPDIAGFGLNWQHSTRQIHVGVTYSFEKTYQALRRSWRFGQKHEVNAHLISAESEGGITQALKRKQLAHAEMQAQMTTAMRENGLAIERPAIIKRESKSMQLPAWMK